MDATKEGSGRAALVGVGALFAAVAVLAAADILADVGEGTTAEHLALEGAIVVVGLAGAIVMAARLRAAVREARALGREARELSSRLDASRAEAEQFKKDAADLIAGLGAAIDRQLERWGLSPAEKDVALLLLKGLSHKEIADVRSVSEATVRQQARALYKKAGLAGRAELAAFFLEDLLGPQG